LRNLHFYKYFTFLQTFYISTNILHFYKYFTFLQIFYISANILHFAFLQTFYISTNILHFYKYFTFYISTNILHFYKYFTFLQIFYILHFYKHFTSLQIFYISTNTTLKFIYKKIIFYILSTFRCALLAPVDYSVVLIVKRDDEDSRSLEMSVQSYKTIRRHMLEYRFTVATVTTSNFMV